MEDRRELIQNMHLLMMLSMVFIFFMFLKFGIGRATSDAAHEIRDNHLTRNEAWIKKP